MTGERSVLRSLLAAGHLLNPLDPTTAAADRSVQSWNGRRWPHTGPSIKKIMANNTDLKATKFLPRPSRYILQQQQLLHACVALSEILIFISFVHAISKIFISIFVMIKYGVT